MPKQYLHNLKLQGIITDDVLEFCLQLVDIAPSEPNIAPFEDGRVMLVWRMPPRYLEITVNEDSYEVFRKNLDTKEATNEDFDGLDLREIKFD